MTDIQALTDDDLAYKVVLLKTLQDLVIAEFKATKAIAGEQFPKGASIPARTAEDRKLGRVTKSDPKPVAVITDAAALFDYITTVHADLVERKVMLGDEEEIVAVLRDTGNEDLFQMVEVVPGWLESKVLKDALTKTIPGVTVKTPEGTVSARNEPAAVEFVKALLSASPVPLLALEG